MEPTCFECSFANTGFRQSPENKWDAIVFPSALHHSVDRRKTLASCYKALKKKGILIASEPGVGHESGKNCQEVVERLDVTEKSTPPYGIARDGKAVGFGSGYLSEPSYASQGRLLFGRPG